MMKAIKRSIWIAAVIAVALIESGCASSGLRVTRTNSVGMELALIPAGEFWMGSSDDADDADVNEKPRHRVRISRPFYMGTCEVTQRQYQQVMESNPSMFKGPALPVEMITQWDAKLFCERLSQLEGRTYRLPTEAEWEYACRAGTTTPYAFGETITTKQANFDGQGEGVHRGRTTPVGSFAPNRWGLHDMHGNVWEWCSDLYSETYYAQSPVEDPQGPEGGTQGGVLRGGGWFYGRWHCRSTARDRFMSVDRFNYHFGFRVVCELNGDNDE